MSSKHVNFGDLYFILVFVGLMLKFPHLFIVTRCRFFFCRKENQISRSTTPEVRMHFRVDIYPFLDKKISQFCLACMMKSVQNLHRCI